MSASYLHFVKQYQNRIGLSNKELNKLDRKHNDVNLIKKLQQLYPRVSAAPAPTNTGWYGVLQIGNSGETGNSINISVESVDGAVVTELIPQTLVTSEDLDTDYLYLNLAIGNRLTSPSTIIRVYYSLVTGELDDYVFDGVQLLGGYFGYVELEVLSGFIDEGNIAMTFSTF
jgi:hypothetical protein